jgi:hypothetical protein
MSLIATLASSPLERGSRGVKMVGEKNKSLIDEIIQKKYF